MTTVTFDTISTWSSRLREHAQRAPLTTVGLYIAVIGVVILLIGGMIDGLNHQNPDILRWGLTAGFAGFIATALGAFPGFFINRLSSRSEDSLLGFSAGMMLAASAFSLILPGIDAGKSLIGNAMGGALLVAVGLALGAMLMLGLDYFTPHEHDHAGPCGPCPERLNRVWLFVFSIALHNLPEGMAMGVGFAGGEYTTGLPLASAIALQDIPEGLAVAVALRSAGLTPLTAALIAAATGAMEPIGSLLGLGLAGGWAFAYPLGMGIAAGAMLFIVSHEVIPETHRNGHQTPATLALMVGFTVMMVMDTALGG